MVGRCPHEIQSFSCVGRWLDWICSLSFVSLLLPNLCSSFLPSSFSLGGEEDLSPPL